VVFFFEKMHPAVYLLMIIILLLFLYGRIPGLIKLCRHDVSALLDFFGSSTFHVDLMMNSTGAAKR